MKEEIDKFPWSRPDLVRKSTDEYFAEAVKEYALRRAAFKKACPKSAKAVEAKLKAITSTDSDFLMTIYGHEAR